MNVTILCDASYCPDHKVAGYGFWIACERGKKGGAGRIVDEVGDTNSAEMMAVCNTIWHGVTDKLILPGDAILIQTDSLAAIDRLNPIRVVTVTEQQKVIYGYFEKAVRRLGLSIEFRHVKGHTTLKGSRYVANRMCDKRAKQEMRAARLDKIAKPQIQSILEVLREH